MHEFWLQKYVKDHFRELGFSRLHGPYAAGADFKGVYFGRAVKVEVEWRYRDYITHKHPPAFAEVLVVATLDPVPETLKSRLPPVIINLDSQRVVDWAHPRAITKQKEDYVSYAWRRFSRNLLYLYGYYQNKLERKPDFFGSSLLGTMSGSQKPVGFQFSQEGKETGFDGSPQDKAVWDYWLEIAHAVAVQFRLKPGLLRATWIDRAAIYVNHSGRITDSELVRFKEVADFIEALTAEQSPVR